MKVVSLQQQPSHHLHGDQAWRPLREVIKRKWDSGHCWGESELWLHACGVLDDLKEHPSWESGLGPAALRSWVTAGFCLRTGLRPLRSCRGSWIGTDRIDLWIWEEKVRDEMNWEIGTDTYTPPCVKQTASGKLLNSTGSSAPCSVIT